MDVRRNIPLIVGLAIPLVMILFVAGSIYLPGVLAQPTNNFLYSTGGDTRNRPLPPAAGDLSISVVPVRECIREEYAVRNGKLVKEETRVPARNDFCTGRGQEIQFYVHDVRKNESTPVSFEQAQKLTLDANQTSPDGFEVARGGGGGGFFPFFLVDGSDYRSYYLKGHGTRHKLNLKRTSDTYSYGGFRFFGWILPPGTPTP